MNAVVRWFDSVTKRDVRTSAEVPFPVQLRSEAGAASDPATETTLAVVSTGIGAPGDTAWNGSGSAAMIALLKPIATAALSTAYPLLPATPVSGITASMTDTTSTAVTGMSAGGAGIFNYITQITIANTDADTDTLVEIQDGSGGTTFYYAPAAKNCGGATISFPSPLKQPTANTALYAKCTTTGATVRVSVTGFQE